MPTAFKPSRVFGDANAAAGRFHFFGDMIEGQPDSVYPASRLGHRVKWPTKGPFVTLLIENRAFCGSESYREANPTEPASATSAAKFDIGPINLYASSTERQGAEWV